MWRDDDGDEAERTIETMMERTIETMVERTRYDGKASSKTKFSKCFISIIKFWLNKGYYGQ